MSILDLFMEPKCILCEERDKQKQIKYIEKYYPIYFYKFKGKYYQSAHIAMKGNFYHKECLINISCNPENYTEKQTKIASDIIYSKNIIKKGIKALGEKRKIRNEYLKKHCIS